MAVHIVRLLLKDLLAENQLSIYGMYRIVWTVNKGLTDVLFQNLIRIKKKKGYRYISELRTGWTVIYRIYYAFF